ncbi:hypothetical protein ABLB69_05490 [Xenorhabdus khoisanae]|uniref:Uncharacterized protein n=1 Tax=Xenorhabdus khoisanae TaxID=880157 RepID=A0A0J5FY02_9GAMM|nr:hypothetical protein [Xenorhabdus khoisanae]KMJ47078.1 hypothetical protein AB204_00050 [Xenorhabdus khoisanae]
MKKTVILFFVGASLPSMASETLDVIKPTVLVALKNGNEQYLSVCDAIKNKCGRSACTILLMLSLSVFAGIWPTH